MPIYTEIDPARQLIICKVKGSVTFHEIMALFNEDYKGDLPSYRLWDFSEGSINKLSPDEIRRLAAFVSEDYGKRDDHKTVAIMPKDVDFGLGSMFHAYAQLNGYKPSIRICRNSEEAMNWLTGEEALLEKSAYPIQ